MLELFRHVSIHQVSTEAYFGGTSMVAQVTLVVFDAVVVKSKNVIVKECRRFIRFAAPLLERKKKTL